MDEHLNLATAFVDGVVNADPRAIAACIAPDGRLRALIPPGLAERQGAAAAGELVASWFADADPLVLVHKAVDFVGDRLHISYRLDGIEDGSEFTVQQQVYAEVTDGRFTDVSLLCSGFRVRVPSQGAGC